MKTPILILTLVSVALSSASARLGDTLQLCQQRYGVPYRTVKQFVYFRKSGFDIMITFFESKADSIRYRKVEKDAKLFDNEIEQLLKVNGGERTWNKVQIPYAERGWVTEDGEMISGYFYDDTGNNLAVFTKGFKDRANTEAKGTENKNLEGF